MKDKTLALKFKILENSSVLFNKFGISKTTIDDISKSLKMGKSSLYYYFKNKEEIYSAVLEKEFSEYSVRLCGSIAEVSGTEEKIKTFAIRKLELMDGSINLHNALDQELRPHNDAVSAIIQKIKTFELGIIKDLLSAGIAKGEILIENTDLAAVMISTALKGFEYEWARRTENTEINKTIEKMTNALFHGISVKQGTVQ